MCSEDILGDGKKNKPLPIGIENFEDIIKTGYYFVDKTLFIKELLDLQGKVNLFIRPRRGLNHLNIISVLDRRYSEHFGFTEPEVLDMMKYYRVESRFHMIKEWYDGYIFGDSEVYNPWSVINYLYDLDADIHAFPRPYWVNTSSNEIIKDLIVRADGNGKDGDKM